MEGGGAILDDPSNLSSSSPLRSVGYGHFRIPCFKVAEEIRGLLEPGEVFGIRSKPRVSRVA